MNLGDKKLNRKINNLQKLMGLIVEFPFLRPFTKFLISLPLDYFYMWVFFAFYGYKVTLRQSSFKGIMKNIINYMAFYFKYVSRLEKNADNIISTINRVIILSVKFLPYNLINIYPYKILNLNPKGNEYLLSKKKTLYSSSKEVE